MLTGDRFDADPAEAVLEAPRERPQVVEQPFAFVLLGTLNGVGPDDLPMAVAQGSKVIAIEPVGSSPAEHAQAYRIVKPADGAPRNTPALVEQYLPRCYGG